VSGIFNYNARPRWHEHNLLSSTNVHIQTKRNYKTLIWRDTSVYFRQLTCKKGKISVCEVVSLDSLHYKPLHNWSPSICSCLYRASYGVSCDWHPTRCGICADICGGLWPQCNDWRNCMMMQYNVQRWANKCGRPFAVSDGLVQSVNQKNVLKTVLHNFRTFVWIPTTVLYEIIICRLGYQKFCIRWVSKMLMDAHKMHRMASALTLLEQYHKYDYEFLNHVTWWNLGFICECWNQRVVKVEDTHTHSPHKPKKFKQTNGVCQTADGNCFLGH
jgi:hypothetical protein